MGKSEKVSASNGKGGAAIAKAAARVGKQAGRKVRADATPQPEPVKAKKATLPQPIAAEDVKLVRDSFTMPREDFELIASLKARALEFRRPTKKSELLRAGLQQLAALPEKQLQAALAALRVLPTGRPKKKH